jgi:ribose 5-phosphate isomerase
MLDEFHKEKLLYEFSSACFANKFFGVGTGETEEEFATRLATNLENLILKEGPETVKFLSPTLCFYAVNRSKAY